MNYGSWTSLSFCLALAGLAGCGEPPRPLRGYANPNQPVQVKVGEEFEIVLSSNATTGYSWSMKAPGDPKVVSFVKQEYVSDPNPKRMTGVGGTDYWAFRAAGTGETTLVFRYGRGPSQDEGEATTFRIIVK